MILKLEQKVIDLKKSAGIVLEKLDLSGIKSQVVLCLDKSGSMNTAYRRGFVDELIQRAVGLALNFDDLGEVEIILFGDGASDAGIVTLETLEGLGTRLLEKYGFDGSTNYAPALKTIRDKYFYSQFEKIFKEQQRQENLGNIGNLLALLSGKTEKNLGKIIGNPIEIPVYVIFVTDGAAFDQKDTINEIINLSKVGCFIQFLAWGDPDSRKFSFLRHLDDELHNRSFIDNVNFAAFPNPASIDPDTLYDAMVTQEFKSWREIARSKGLIL